MIPADPSESHHWDLPFYPDFGSSHCSVNMCSHRSLLLLYTFTPPACLSLEMQKRLLIDEDNSSTIILWWAFYDHLLQWYLQNIYSCQSTGKLLG